MSLLWERKAEAAGTLPPPSGKPASIDDWLMFDAKVREHN
jgi:hypothetical protein